MTTDDRRRSAARANYSTTINFEKRQRLDRHVVGSDGASPAELLATVPSGSAIVDIGCGNGHWLDAASQRGPTVGIDLSLPMLERARTCARVPLVCADAVRLPIRDDVADVALLFLVLHHVPVESAIAEARRVVRSGGRLMAATNAEHPAGPHLDIIREALRIVIGPVGEWLEPLAFHGGNGARLIGSCFGDVVAHPWVTTVALLDPAPLVAHLDSLRDPVELVLGADLPWDDVLAETDRLAAAHIAIHGELRFQRKRTVFVAR